MIDIRLREFCKDRSGAAIILAALMMPVLVGGMGLGAETGYRYYNQRLLQHAADFSAHAGAVRQAHGYSDIEPSARHVATQSGWAPEPIGGIIVNPDYPWGTREAVEVVLVETRPRLFSAIFSEDPVQIGARAVAAVTKVGSSGCILALSGTASPAIEVSGSTSVTLTGCSVAANSRAEDAFSISNAISEPFTAECLQTSGGVDVHHQAPDPVLLGEDCPAPVVQAPRVRDPYADVAEPVVAGTCQNKNVTDGSEITMENHPSGVQFAHFCNGLDFKGDVTLKPGLYIISGGTMTLSGTSTPSLTGEGVTFYFTGTGAAKLNANADLNLSAPESGPYKGILFFGSETQTGITHSVRGDATLSKMEGAIYMPTSHVEFSGNSGTGGCTQLIANTIEMTGNSTLETDCDPDVYKQIEVGLTIEIVE